MEGVDGIWLTVALAAAAGALVGIAAGYLLARRSVRPIATLRRSVSRMAAGEIAEPVSREGAGELALLADAVNELRERVGAQIAEARASQRTLELILSSMEEGIVLVDADDRTGYTNGAAARLLGGAPSSLRSLAPHALARLVAASRAAGRVRQVEVEAGIPSRTLRATALPVGADDRVLLVLRDVTEARRVEAMRRDFVTNASHELKTPVASIQAAAETVRQAIGEDPEGAGRFAEQLHRNAVRLSRMVTDLLDLSRLEAEPPTLQPVRLDRLATREADRFREPAREAGLEIESEAQEVTVPGSREDLALLVRNLLDNAVRYTPAGGRIRVEVTRRDAEAVLIVRDTGIGIPSRDLPRIFERFYRVDRARSRETGGTGLGLSIARHVAEQHGGAIEVDSELGRGSTFRVRLPLEGPSTARG